MFEGFLQPMHLLLIPGTALILLRPRDCPELGRSLDEAIRGFEEFFRNRRRTRKKNPTRNHPWSRGDTCGILVRALVGAITILIATLLPAVACAANRSAATAALGSMGGTVKSNGSPVADATVHIWRDGKHVAAVNVTPNGFSFSAAAGTYEVQASAPHFRPEVANRITVVVHSGGETWVNLVLVPVQ